MSNQKARELLEEIKRISSLPNIFVKKVAIEAIKIHAISALAELKQPECKTCGGSKRVPSLWGMTQMHGYTEEMATSTKPCPDCQQPEKIYVCPHCKKQSTDPTLPHSCQQPEPSKWDSVYEGLMSTPNSIVAGEEEIIIDRQAAKAKKWEDRWHRLDNTNVEAMKRLTRVEAKNKILKEAVGLLNSMIIGGEKHSDKSKKVVNQALNSKQKGK